MNKRLRYLIVAGVLAVECSAALAQPAIGTINVPPMPTKLQVPDGNTLFLSGHAQGTQNYICLPSAGGFAWTFFSPQATLFFDFKLGPITVHQQIITHFLSPNPDENGTGRATWQSSMDSSAVWGKLAPDGSSNDSNFVAAGAIPWLLLQAVGKRTGPTGGDVLANTTYIQRLNTGGGVAPSIGCSTVANIGATALVPYSADYFFYKANRPQ
jgi:hypothetical protein